MEEFAVNVTEVPWQNGFGGKADMFIVAGKDELTIMVIGFDVTGLPLAHIRLEVITQVNTCPLIGLLTVSWELVPTHGPPLICQQ